MRHYNAGKWGVNLRFVISADGSVIPRASVWGFICAALTFLMHMGFQSRFNVTKNVLDMWTGYTFVLGFLTVFRNNLAYSRFWDGAALIQRIRGEWFNVVSSLFAFCSDAKEVAASVKKFQMTSVRLMSMLFFVALQEVADIEVSDFEVIDMNGMESCSQSFLKTSKEKSEVIVQWIQRSIMDAQRTGVLCVPPPILSRSFQELSRGVVNLADAKKIKEIPFPFPYAQVATIMLLVYTGMTACFTSQHIESRFWACMVSYIVSTAFWSLNYIAQELEQPFGVDPNDLPLKELQDSMNESLMALLHPLMQNCPNIGFDDSRYASNIDTTPGAAQLGLESEAPGSGGMAGFVGQMRKSVLGSPPSKRKSQASGTPKHRRSLGSFIEQADVEKPLTGRRPYPGEDLGIDSGGGAPPRPLTGRNSVIPDVHSSLPPPGLAPKPANGIRQGANGACENDYSRQRSSDTLSAGSVNSEARQPSAPAVPCSTIAKPAAAAATAATLGSSGPPGCEGHGNRGLTICTIDVAVATPDEVALQVFDGGCGEVADEYFKASTESEITDAGNLELLPSAEASAEACDPACGHAWVSATVRA